MGRNWRDYLAEAHRTLQPYGLLFIAEPARRWEGTEDLEKAVRAVGFELLPTTRRGDFLYLRGIKVYSSSRREWSPWLRRAGS